MRQPLKVLINALHAKSGGGVTYLRNMLPYLAADPSIEVHLCIHDSQSAIIGDLPDGVIPHRMSFRPGFWWLAYYEQTLIPRLARSIGAAVTFSPANYGPLFAPGQVIMIRNALGVAFIEKRLSKIAYWFMIYIATVLSIFRARQVIAVSDFVVHTTGKTMSRWVIKKYSIIHHGVSDVFSPPEKEQQRDSFILAVSDIYVQKNYINLLIVIDRLREKHPDIVLKIAGRPVDGDYYAGLQKIIAERGMQNNIHFLGSVTHEELASLYRQCRLFVFPSLVESFGNPLVEAMASGAPVATSNAAAMPEVAGSVALLFDPDNIDHMTDSLGRLYEDDELRQTLSKLALQRASKFSWSRTAKATIEIFKAAAGRDVK